MAGQTVLYGLGRDILTSLKGGYRLPCLFSLSLTLTGSSLGNRMVEPLLITSLGAAKQRETDPFSRLPREGKS